jgi:hypothetical protein
LKCHFLVAVMVLLVAGPASALELDGTVVKGTLRIGLVTPGESVAVDGKQVCVDAQTGRFVVGIGRDRSEPLQITVTGADGTSEIFCFPVTIRDYEIERIDGLPPRKVSPDQADMDRILREGRLISAARAHDSGLVHALAGFRWPMTGRISGRYGNQRILNGEPRRPHLGVDIAASPGTPVGASAAGVVSLGEPDLFYTGGTIVIDHGHGVTSIYSHLAAIDVAVGREVRLDPELTAGPMPEPR